jgi:preprotein translocase subunit SecD
VQGADRIVVQLPGVQDVSRARDMIGRTATLEVRMVDETVTRGTEETAAIPFGSELFKVGKSVPVVLYKDVVLTGEYISSATGQHRPEQSAGRQHRPERRRRPPHARSNPRARRQVDGHRAV